MNKKPNVFPCFQITLIRMLRMIYIIKRQAQAFNDLFGICYLLFFLVLSVYIFISTIKK